MKPLLTVQNLRKYFPVYKGIFQKIVGHIKALGGVDFSISEGQVLGVVGESGSGKSTLGRTILRLIEPSEGEIHFEGRDLLKFTTEELRLFRQEAQMIFQNPYAALNPRKTVGESIGEAIYYHRLVKTKAQARDRVAEILTQVGLSDDVMNRYPHQFSGGQQQRICIGRALALSPRLLVCDEVVSALDVSIQAQILNLLKHLQRQYHLSYLFISHDLSVIKYLCDEVIVLYLGKVMERASTKDLFFSPKHPYTQALFSAIPKNHPNEKKARMILKGEIPSMLNPPSGCPFRTRCPYAQPQCAEPPPKKVVKGAISQEPNHEYYCILD